MGNVTLESLLTRIKKEVAQKAVESEKKKAEAKAERARRSEPMSIYEREDLWIPKAIHREYELQLCDCCKGEKTVFNCEKVELHHKVDRSARRWIRERGEGMDDLPLTVTVSERVIPECFDCHTVGKMLQHLFKKGPGNAQAQV